MWYSIIIRFLRRRIVLGIIFTLSLLYCVANFLGQGSFLDSEEALPVRTQPFVWRTLQQHNQSSGNVVCRNSVQGKVYIVDDRGFVCPRHEIATSGCCSENLSEIIQYTCETCQRNNCCAIYEHCVSCCLHPDKRDMLENLLGKAAAQNNVLFASVSDHFELCLAKCRTNSQSVQHENSYKDPEAKHCFGEKAPGYKNVDT